MTSAELDRMGYLLDPVAFARELLEFSPDARQAEVLRGGARRLLLNCSRQWGKSSTAAAIAAHRAYCYGGSLVVCVSPTERQAGELVRKIRQFLLRAGVALREQPDQLDAARMDRALWACQGRRRPCGAIAPPVWW